MGLFYLTDLMRLKRACVKHQNESCTHKNNDFANADAPKLTICAGRVSWIGIGLRIEPYRTPVKRNPKARTSTLQVKNNMPNRCIDCIKHIRYLVFGALVG